jgi:hypothetical protein
VTLGSKEIPELSMKALCLLTVLGLAAAAPVGAAEPFEVLRPGDQALACQDLASEVNALNAAVADRAKAAQAKAKRAESGRKMLGFAASAMSGAMPALAARANSPLGSAAAQAAMSAVQQGQMASQMGQMGQMGLMAQMGAMGMMAGPGMGQADVPPELPEAPEQARIDHLSRIFAQKAC